jgi:hypothetical protein
MWRKGTAHYTPQSHTLQCPIFKMEYYQKFKIQPKDGRIYYSNYLPYATEEKKTFF